MARSAVKTCRWCRRPPRAAPAAPAPSPQAEARRDYELALQIGNKSALNAFLAQYPDGFYASLAKLQLEKFAAEEARVIATEKARLAEQERARLAAEGAQKAQQAKADADAKAAEKARIAAEKAKQVAQDQAAAAEQKRTAAEAQAAEKAGATQLVASHADASRAPSTAERSQGDKGADLAALTTGAPPVDITKSVQAELRRVGCLTASTDGQWNAASQRSMALFNRHAGTRLDVKLASLDALDAIKLKTSRVCPLVCEHGLKADGDRCSKIICAEGSFLNDDNECEKRRARKPVASRDSDVRRERERPATSAARGRRVQASRVGRRAGQIVCNSHICRPVQRGCRIVHQGGSPRDGSGGNVEVCN